jgi:hypothetical protein
VLKRINALLTDIRRHGNDGMDKPEALKHDFAGYGHEASTRRPSCQPWRARCCCWRSALSGFAVPTIGVVALLGFFGVGANPVLISLAVGSQARHPAWVRAQRVGVQLRHRCGLLGSRPRPRLTLGGTGPAVVGTVIAALTLIPTIAIAVT